MPVSPYAKVLVTVNGGAPTSGYVLAHAGDVIQPVAENSDDWNTQRWELLDYQPDGFAPSGWTVDASGILYSLAVTPPPFTIDPTQWGKWFLRLTVDQGVERGVPTARLVDDTTIVEVVSPEGIFDIAAGETTQIGGARKRWLWALQKTLRVLAALVGRRQFKTTSATTADQTIAVISVPANSGGSKLKIEVVAHRIGAFGELYSADVGTLYYEIGAGPVKVGTDTVTDPKTVGGGSASLNTTPSGATVLVRATPWSANPIAWTTSYRVLPAT